MANRRGLIEQLNLLTLDQFGARPGTLYLSVMPAGGRPALPRTNFFRTRSEIRLHGPQIFLPLSNEARIENEKPGSNPNNSARRRI